MTDIAGLIRDARLPEKTVPVCLRPDLVAQYEDLEAQRAEACKTTADSLAGSGVADLDAQLGVLRGEMTASTVPFVFRALPRNKFRALAAQHPPRQNEDGTVVSYDVVGINDSTFPTALIRACLVDPDLDNELWEALDDKLTDRQYQALVDAAWTLNRSEVDIPFSRAVSPEMKISEPR